MNILFVLEYYPPHVGGVEFLFERIAQGLAARGHSVKVLTTRLPTMKKREDRGGVIIERVNVPFDSRSLFSIWTIPTAIRMARWADVIHTSTYNAIPPASIAGTLTRTPVLITGHERLGKLWFTLPRISRLKAGALYLAEHILYRFPSARIAAVSEASRRDVIEAGIRASKVTRIYNAFEEAPWTAPDLPERTNALADELELHDKTVIATYGRPGITKGIEYAIAAFPRIKQELPNAKLLVIISRRPEQGYLAISHMLDQMRDDVIERNDVPFSELPAYVNLADVVIVPSLTEGFGYTTLEASTLEKRIVASDAGAIPEVIFGRYILVAPRNPDAIAHAAVRLVKMPIDATAPKRFSAEATIDAYESAYEEISGRDGTKRSRRPR